MGFGRVPLVAVCRHGYVISTSQDWQALQEQPSKAAHGGAIAQSIARRAQRCATWCRQRYSCAAHKTASCSEFVQFERDLDLAERQA